MATDFSYNGKQIVSGGPFKPGGKDMPSDARTRVESYADIASIPNPHVGLKVTVKVDETNNNKMTDYIVKSLKANASGIANSVVDQVQRYVDYLGAGSVSQDDINTAVNNYLTEHPVTSGATTEQVNQIEANRVAIGDTNSGLTKEVNDIKNVELQNLNTTILGINETLGDKTGLPSGDANIIASINRIDGKTSSGSGLTDEQLNKLNSIDNKVDKIIGKQLSTEDYTSQEKADLANLKTTIGDNNSGLVKDVTDLKNNGVSQDNINSAVEKYLQNNPIGIEDYNPEDIFIVGNMDMDIATDGLVLWINSNVKNGKTLSDLSGNGNNVSFDSTGFTFEGNGGVSVNSDNGSVLTMVTIPETNILTLEYTITATSPAIGGSPVIATYNTREECGFRFGASQDYYINYGAIINKNGDKTGDPKLMDSETMTTASLLAQIGEYGTGTPHHLVVRYTPEIKKMEMFLDGSLYKYYVDFSETNGVNTLVTKIGFFYIDVNNPYSGSDRKDTILYDAKAYNKSLSNEEILKNYNNLVKNGVI